MPLPCVWLQGGSTVTSVSRASSSMSRASSSTAEELQGKLEELEEVAEDSKTALAKLQVEHTTALKVRAWVHAHTYLHTLSNLHWHGLPWAAPGVPPCAGAWAWARKLEPVLDPGTTQPAVPVSMCHHESYCLLQELGRVKSESALQVHNLQRLKSECQKLRVQRQEQAAEARALRQELATLRGLLENADKGLK